MLYNGAVVKPNRRLKLLFIFLPLIAINLYFLYRSRFSPKIYIDKQELTQFNRLVPKSPESCSQTNTIEYYFYEDVSLQERKNNKFGLYVYPDNEKFIELADMLVNSNEGDWGYVLIPYDVNDTDRGKWERVFYLLNKKHLIPIVQLWNIKTEKYESSTVKAAEFLNSFIWPIKDRYISVYNEPNDANFWYGRVDPAEYATILDYTIDEFRKENDDYFMINGAFNVSAATNNESLESFEYMRRMNAAVPGIFSKLDGWASHSYPQPNFSGSPYATGRWSIKAYEEELNYLQNTFGVTDLPVFITETGWAHDVGKTFDNQYLPIGVVANNMKIAYEEVWLPDDRVVAVMPFSIWYAPPFDHFSWVDSRWVPYEHFQKIKAMKKIAGNPAKLSVAELSSLGCEE